MGCAAPEHAQLVGLWMEMGIIIIKGRCSMYMLASAAARARRQPIFRFPSGLGLQPAAERLLLLLAG